MLDYHIHLERGPYTIDWFKQFYCRAREVGIRELGIVEHLYLFEEARDILCNEHTLKLQRGSVYRFIDFVHKLKDMGYPVKLGLEVDYIPEKESQIESLVSSLPLDFVIGSVHYIDGWPFDLDSEWEGRDITRVYQEYYRLLSQASNCGMFDILGHPGNIAYFGHFPNPAALRDIEESFVNNVAGTSIVIEVNTGGFLRPVEQLFPRPELLEALVARGCDFTLSSDAHNPGDVGHRCSWAVSYLRNRGVKTLVGFSQRRACHHPI